MKRILLLSLAILVLGAAGFGAWVVIERKQVAERREAAILKLLSTDDLKLVLESQRGHNPTGATDIVSSVESRGAFLKGLREYLALAAAARREGMSEDPLFEINFEYKKNDLLAEIYEARLNKGRETPFRFSDDEIAAVWQDPLNQQAFERDMETLRSIQRAASRNTRSLIPPTILQGDALEKARKRWALSLLYSNLAKADADFMGSPELRLRIKLLEAGILSADFLRKHFQDNIMASADEIKAFLSEHPEYDISKKRAMAESVLQRVRAGEDFAKLAGEFSEHRPTKSSGGLFEGLAPGQIWPELEAAALSLQEGEIASKLIETELGFHILKLEKRKVTKAGDGAENVTFSIRHILLQRKFEDPTVRASNVPPPFMSGEEIARNAVEKRKRDEFVTKVVAENNISIPDQTEFESVIVSAK